MAHVRLNQSTSRRRGKVPEGRARGGGSAETRKSGSSSGGSAVLRAALDKLRDAAAAHDKDLPAPHLPS
jgi:hypothetical protein